MASNPISTLLGDPAQYYQLLQQGVDVTPPIDLQAPLPYRDWIVYNSAVLPTQRLNKYNDYLQSWYYSYYQTIDTEQRVYQDYKQLVESLLAVFGNDSELQRISDLDLTDTFQLNVAIPYLSRKLKDIAVYYLQKRDDIKHAKVRYNMVGSNGGIQQIVYNNILRTFAKGPQTIVLDENTWQHLPQLSAVNASFKIEIDELYDENEYLDKSPDVTYDWPQVDDNWMYTTGLYTLTSTNPLIFSLKNYLDQHNSLFIDQLPLTEFDNGSSGGTLNVYNHSELSSQLIGTTQYFASGGYSVAQTDEFIIDIQTGTNTFYWPQGEFYLESVNLYNYEPMLLTSTNFARDGATAGTTLENSDVIWVNDGNTLSGAWLRDFSYTDVQATMMAELKRNKATVFKFPFPGFGTTSARQAWTGKQLTNFESRSTQADAVEAQQLYWSETNTASTSKPISIHDTTLIACGARGSSKFFDADKIVVRKDTSDGVHDSAPNLVFNNAVETAWLYQPLYTQLPIKVGTTLIYWPFFTDEQASNPAFEIKNYAADTIMLSATDSTIAFRGAIASTVPEKADIIEMVDCDNVVMRAWLSGCDVKLSLPENENAWLTGTTQPGLNLNLQSGAWTHFVYDAPDRLPINITDVKSFVGYNHQPDCAYLRATKKSLTKARNGVDDTGCSTWRQCNCKAVYYTPFGHNGASYNDNHKMADVIMVDTQYPSPPNINTWKGRDGAPFSVSNDFAWFRVEGNPEPDVGWGPGVWKTNDGLPFELEPGVRYAYYRVPICCDQQGPPLIVSHSYCDCGGSKEGTALNCSMCVDPYTFIKTCDCEVEPIDYCCRPVWVGMALVDGEWVSTNARSAMPLIAGQKYRYTHRDSTEYSWADQNEIFSIKTEAIDFLLTQQLNGWGTDTTTHCSSCIGAYPYWATSQSTGSNGLINCHTNVSPSSPAPYLLVTNPAASRIELTSDLYMEYHRSNTPTLVWSQPVEITVFEPKVQWCHINIEPTHIDQIITDMHVSNCSDCAVTVANSRGACQCEDVAEVQINLGCNAHRVIVSATDVPSEIVLNGKTMCSDYTVMSYCAVNGFSTSHELVNTTLPSVFVPQVTGVLANAVQPWNNIANRHYPTVAMFTDTLSLSTLDQYGLLNPSSHGTLTFVGQNYNNEIALQGQQFTEIVAMVEPSFWSNSRGLTQADNNRLVSTLGNDARWFKSSMFDGAFSGSVLHGNKYQTFVPYQTEQQIRATHNGFRTDKQTMWDDIVNVESDFHNYQDIELWNSEQPNITGIMTNWATDLFGNQYMLIKPQSVAETFSIHQQRTSNTGTLWVRTVTDDIVLGSQGLQPLYTKYLALSSTIYNQLTGGNICQMQLFGNTLMLVLSSHVLIDKLDYDLDLQQIVASDDATVFIDFASAKNVGAPSASNIYNNFNYGGHWYDPSHEKLLVLTSAQDSLTTLPYINIYSIDTHNHKFSKLYPKTTADVDVWGSANDQLQLQTYPADGSGNPWVLMSGAPTVTVNKDNGQLICHYILNNYLQSTKHLFVTAIWQMTETCDQVTLVSIDVKQSRV